jgi:hypothetical protein
MEDKGKTAKKEAKRDKSEEPWDEDQLEDKHNVIKEEVYKGHYYSDRA